MRVLIAHYRYFVSGGPERYLFNIKRLLEARGHEVVIFSVAYRQNVETDWAPYFVSPIAGSDEVYFDEHSWTPRSVVRALKATFYSPEVHRSLSRLIRDARPDVALVLQYLRKMSPSVLAALHRARVPVAVRLSDFHMVCPGAHLTRDGISCTECVGRTPFPSVRYGCVKGSRLLSAVELAATFLHRSTGIFDSIGTFVAPTTVMRDLMVRGGWAADRMRVIPTPVALPEPVSATRRDTIVFVGRVERLKGVFVIVDAYARLARECGPSVPRLAIVGNTEGEQGAELRDWVSQLGLDDRVVFAGEQDIEGVREWLQRALVSLVPSIALDNLPNSMLESLAAGAPIIASNQPTFREVLAGLEAGTLVPAGDAAALALAMKEYVQDPARVARAGAAARALAEQRFSEADHVDALERVFANLVSR